MSEPFILPFKFQLRIFRRVNKESRSSCCTALAVRYCFFASFKFWMHLIIRRYKRVLKCKNLSVQWKYSQSKKMFCSCWSSFLQNLQVSPSFYKWGENATTTTLNFLHDFSALNNSSVASASILSNVTLRYCLDLPFYWYDILSNFRCMWWWSNKVSALDVTLWTC